LSAEKTHHEISIVTINYNNAAGLEKTIQSVQAQTYSCIQHIVYDGNSTDGSADVIDRFSSGIAVRKTGRNGGIYYNQNRGLELATGEYVLFLNSGDCLNEPSSIGSMVEMLNQKIDIAYGNLIFEKDGIRRLKEYPQKLDRDFFIADSLPHPASLIRTAFIKKRGGYDETLKICSDWKFFVKSFFEWNACFQYIPVAVSVFNEEGISSRPESIPLMIAERNGVWSTLPSGSAWIARMDRILSRMKNMVSRCQ
jgi:glycosyltransferase involved in cell wall biosynthesis